MSDIELLPEADDLRDRKPILVVGIRRPSHVARDFGGGVTTRRLEKLMGVKQGMLLEVVDATNLLGPDEPEERPLFRARADQLIADGHLAGRELIILCGQHVHSAFGFSNAPTLEQDPGARSLRGVAVAIMPHPSGQNRVWNDLETTAKVRAAIRALTAALVPDRLIEDGVQAAAVRKAVAQVGAWKEKFLANVRNLGVYTVAARMAEISPTTVAAHRARDSEFDLACVEARQAFVDRCKAEVAKRALYGTKRPIFQGGVQVGEETVYNDNLLLRLLAAMDPDEWAERRKNEFGGMQGKDAKPITIQGLLQAALADEAAQKQLEGMQDQKGRLLLMGVAKDLDKIDESIQAERAALKKKDERDADERPR